MIWVVLIISLILSTGIVNGAQKLFMKWLNIDALFTIPRTKVIAIVVLALFITAACTHLFGIEIPK